MHGHQFQIGKARQRSRKDQVVKRERRIEWIAEHVVEVEMGQALAMGEAVRMHHDEGAELLGPGEERTEFRIGQFLAVDIGQDFDALQLQVLHDVVEFAHRDLRLLQGDDAETDEPVGLARAIFRHAVIGEAMRGFRDLGIDRIITLGPGARRDDLDIDAHLVEIEQAAIDRGHDLARRPSPAGR